MSMPDFINPTLVAHLVLIFIIFNVLVLVGRLHGVDGAQGLRLHPGPRRPEPRRPRRACCSRSPTSSSCCSKKTCGRRRPTRSSSRSRRSSRPPPRSRRSRSCRSAPQTTLFGLLDEPMRARGRPTSTSRVLVIFAITSMGIYGIVLAGWSSNSKYSLLGGLRSSAQMISYELSYGLALAAVVHAGRLAVAARDRRPTSPATGST